MYLLLRAAKVLAVALLFAGSIGAVFARDLEERRRFAYHLAGPGFGAAWMLGFALALNQSASFLSTWVLGGLVLSLFSIQVVLYSVGREGRRGVGTAALVLLPLAGTVTLMIFKPT